VCARVISGIAAGLMSGAGTATVIDLYGPQRKSVAGITAVAVNTGGLALGTLSGVLADLTDAALVVPYLVYLALTIVAVGATMFGLPADPRKT
jgi:MFS family permease